MSGKDYTTMQLMAFSRSAAFCSALGDRLSQFA
jgi:hypothetical protein